MTTVNISIKHHVEDGSLVGPEAGVLTFAPVRRYVNGEKSIVLPIGFDVTLSEDGTATVELEPTDGTFAWGVTEQYGALKYLRYVEVPESEETVEYADLTDVRVTDLAPVTMGDSRILKVMLATDAEQAMELSLAHPDYVVLYDMTAEAANVETTAVQLAALAAQADADAKQVAAAKSGVMSDSGTVSALAANTVSLSDSISVQAARVETQAADAINRISTAVDAVEQAAAGTSETGAGDSSAADATADATDSTAAAAGES